MTATSPMPSFRPLDFSPHHPDFIENPYPAYRRMRESLPIAWVEEYQRWWCFRYDDCKRILEDEHVFRKNSPLPPPRPAPPLLSVLGSRPQGVFDLDHPRHGEIRPLLDGLFGKAIDGVIPQVGTIAQALSLIHI